MGCVSSSRALAAWVRAVVQFNRLSVCWTSGCSASALHHGYRRHRHCSSWSGLQDKSDCVSRSLARIESASWSRRVVLVERILGQLRLFGIARWLMAAGGVAGVLYLCSVAAVGTVPSLAASGDEAPLPVT